jgi:hypothetical protein
MTLQDSVDKVSSLLDLSNYAGATTYHDRALAIDPNFKEALGSKSDAVYNLCK